MPLSGESTAPAGRTAPAAPAAARCAVVGLVAAGLAAYANSFSGRFVFLDGPAILDNPTIRHLWPLGRVLSPPSDGGLTVGGRPLVNLSLAVNYAISGTDIWSYHALNLLIHLLAGLTLFGLTRRTVQNFARARRSPSGGEGGPGSARRTDPFPVTFAFAVALLWMVHPLQTESVTYVVQRAESLMGLFYLLTLYCFIRGAARLRSLDASFDAANFSPALRAAKNLKVDGCLGWWSLSIAACLFGMATKEVMVSAPLIVFLYDRTFVSGSFREAWRRHGRLFAALAGTWLLLGVLVLSTGGNRGGTAGFGTGFSWERYVLTQFPAAVHYLRLAIWPHPLDFYSGAQWVRGFGSIAPEMALIAVLLGATVYALIRRPPADGTSAAPVGNRALGFAGVWFFAILAPTSLVPGMSQTMAEHRMYVALAPVLAVIVWVVFATGRAMTAAAGATRASAPGLVFCLLAAVGLGFLTHRRNEIYRSDLTLWGDTAAQSPDDPYVQNNLGIALVDADRPAEAEVHFVRALQLRPDYAEAGNNLGLILAQTGRLPEAIARYEQALRARPAYPEAQANLGVALAKSGRMPEAIHHFQEALRLKPEDPTAQNDLAVVLAGAGRLPEAIGHYEQVLRLTPDNPEVHYNLANALAQTGRPAEAAAHYEEAVRLRPAYPEALANLGATLAGLGRLPEAVAEDEKALRLDPDDPDVHTNLGLALRALGRNPEAEAQLAEAARLRSGHPPGPP